MHLQEVYSHIHKYTWISGWVERKHWRAAQKLTRIKLNFILIEFIFCKLQINIWMNLYVCVAMVHIAWKVCHALFHNTHTHIHKNAHMSIVNCWAHIFMCVSVCVCLCVRAEIFHSIKAFRVFKVDFLIPWSCSFCVQHVSWKMYAIFMRL